MSGEWIKATMELVISPIVVKQTLPKHPCLLRQGVFLRILACLSWQSSVESNQVARPLFQMLNGYTIFREGVLP